MPDFPDRLTKPITPLDPVSPKQDEPGPARPDVERPMAPERKSILDRMKRVDPDQARRYRQRSGQ